MQIQLNTDHNIPGVEALGAHVNTVVETALSRFAHQITRVEVHLSDETGGKGGPGSIRCVMEVRIDGHQPIAVTDDAGSVHQAIAGAATKIEHAVGHLLGRLHDDHH